MIGILHINRPSTTRFQARVRYRGHRKYKLVGKPSKSCTKAIMDLARAMSSRNYKRGDVLMWADYYDPTLVVEMVRA